MAPPPRQTRRMRRTRDNSLCLTKSQIALILSAQVRGEKSVRARPLVTEKTLKALSTKAEKNRRLYDAQDLLKEWLEEESSFPVGTARFLACGPNAKVSRALGLYDTAVRVMKQHNSDCPDHCEDLVHSGQYSPDVSIVMLSALDSSISNISRVVATSPQLFQSAMITYDSGDGLIIPPEATAGLTPLEEIELQKISVYNLPGTLSSDGTQQGTKNFVNDLLVEDMIAGLAKISLDTCTKQILCFQNDKFKFKLSFKRLLQHWAVSENIAHNSITRFLRLLHYYRPETICYESLPRTGRALLSTSVSKLAESGLVKTYTACERVDHEVFCDCESSNIQHGKVRPIVIDNKLKPGRKIMLGRYAHYGLEKAVNGTSFGLLHRFHYRYLLRHIHQVRPGFLPDFFLNLTRPQEDEPFDRETWEKWIKPKQNNPLFCGKPAEPIVFQVRINVDGAQFFESSHIKGIPIQGKLVAIRSLSGDFKFKVPYGLGKPFMIGIFEQTSGKPPAFLLMEDTIKEMIALQPSKLGPGEEREGKCFAVEVVCFNCDAPMRSDLKGTKSCNGYYGCERCETKGEHHLTKAATAPNPSSGVPGGAAAVPAPLSKSTVKTKFVKRITGDYIDQEGNHVQKVQWIRVTKVVNQHQPPDGRSPSAHDQLQDIQDPPSGSTSSAVASSSSSAAAPSSSTESSSSAAAVDAESSNDKRNGTKRRAVRSALPKSQATLSQKKQRQQAYDDGFEDGDDEADDDSMLINNKPADDVNTAAAAAAVPVVAQPQKKGPAGGGSIYFPEIGAAPRADKYWSTYSRMMSLKEGDVSIHKVRDSFLDHPSVKEAGFTFPMVSGFFLDPMHLIDGGVLKDFFERIIRKLGQSTGKMNSKAPVVAGLQNCIDVYNTCKIVELCKFRSVTNLKIWKMREFHVVFMYYALPLFKIFEKNINSGSDGRGFGHNVLQAMKFLLRGLHLTKGFSNEPIPEKQLQEAQASFVQFLHLYTDIFGVQAMTSKAHALQHVLDDCRTQGCHLDYNSVYDAESEQGAWKKGEFIRSGTRIMEQITNRFAERAVYLLPTRDPNGDDPEIDQLGCSEAALQYMIKHQTLELPPNFFLRKVQKSSLFSTLRYKAYDVRDKFPNNIVRLEDGRIMCVIKIRTIHSEIKPADATKGKTADDSSDVQKMNTEHFLVGYCFPKTSTKPWFEDPFNSEEIGFFSVSGRVELRPTWEPATRVHSKCLILPATFVRSGADPYELDKYYINPIPDHVRDTMRLPLRRFSSGVTGKSEAIRQAYESKKCYPSGRREDATWIVISLLCPVDDN